MVGETRPNSKMSVKFVAVGAGVGERERRARHTIATSLVKDHAHNSYDMLYIRTF